MAYPKPLSEKTLQKMYITSEINEEKAQFLHTFFMAAANLYGAVTMRELWQIYCELSKTEKWPVLKRKEILAFSEITRREPNQPYYIYEIDELYCEEQRAELDRFLIRKDVIWERYRSLEPFWKMAELQYNKPFYMPKDLLSYAKMKKTPEEEALINFVGNLRVTARTSKVYQREVKCIHFGKCLKDFEGRLDFEQSMIDYYGGKYENGPKENKRLVDKLEAEYSGIFSERLVKELMWRSSTGWVDISMSIKMFTDAVDEIGVRLSRKQLEILISLVMNAHNNSNLMCNRGWKPSELLVKTYVPGMVPQISFGPGMQKLFAEGNLNKEDLVRRLNEMGISVL